MILTIIFLGMILLGIIFEILYDKYCNDFLGVFGPLNIVIGSICLITAMIIIIFSHTTSPKTIQENKLEYDGLCKRYEVIKSEYEDVSKSDVIADITAWNMKVYDTKYWTNNPWTNWFNPKEIADNMDYISLE